MGGWIGGFLSGHVVQREMISMQVPALVLPGRLLEKNFRALGLISIKVVYMALNSPGAEKEAYGNNEVKLFSHQRER